MSESLSDSAKVSESKAEASGSTRRSPASIPRMFQSGNTATIQAEIRSVYGFGVSAQFARDLQAFVEKAMRGDYTDK